MTPVTDPATDSRVVRLYPSPLNTGTFDLDTVTLTADSIVRDILQIVAAGRIDDDARAAFRDWIVDAWLALPTALQIEQLCQAAGFASVVDPVTLKARIDELHATLAAQSAGTAAVPRTPRHAACGGAGHRRHVGAGRPGLCGATPGRADPEVRGRAMTDPYALSAAARLTPA